jgi:hypothetical protein
VIDPEIRQLILNLIVDCRDCGAPFALTYHEMGIELGRPPDIELALRELKTMVDEGLVRETIVRDDGERAPTMSEREERYARYRTWLPAETDLGALQMDEGGMWYAMTEKGRAYWRAHLPDDYVEPPLWRVTEDFEREPKTVTVLAESVAVANTAIESWKTTNPDWQEVPGSRQTQHLPRFELHPDRIIIDGVKLTFRKAQRPTT